MRDAKKQIRHTAITQVAYDLLATNGYNGTSMLSIAKAAKASNETLYRWYTNKRGLFEAMVQDNAAEIKTMLEQAIDAGDDPRQTLEKLSPVFLKMVLGDRAILLNRAAAADPTGELGAAISAGGRDIIQPLFGKIIQQLSQGTNHTPQDLATWYIGLLVGDLQIKRAIGVMPPLSQAQIDAHVQTALAAFYVLLKNS